MTDLRIDPVFDALKQPLALVDDDARRRQLEAYIEAARPQVERAVYDVVSHLVEALGEQVGDHYRVRLAYRPGGLTLEVEEKVGDGEEARWSSMEGDVEKITVRIPAELKDLATQAAARAGTSANTWVIKALARAIRNMEGQQQSPPTWREERRQHGSRMSGWVGGDDDV